MGVKIDILEILRQKDRLDDVNAEVASTLSKVDTELNNCCTNLTGGGTALEVSVASLISVNSSVTEKLKKAIPKLITFMDTQMESYNVSLTEANNELNQLVSILKATFESDGDITRTYKEANRYINLPSGNEIVDNAMQYVGGSYVYGGKNLTESGGVDCSSFVREIYEEYGYQLDQTTYTQINQGDIVDISGGNYENLQPGDLIFYGSIDNPHHVAIYAGNGQIVHAATSTRGICTNDMLWEGTPCAARRIIGSENVTVIEE